MVLNFQLRLFELPYLVPRGPVQINMFSFFKSFLSKAKLGLSSFPHQISIWELCSTWTAQNKTVCGTYINISFRKTLYRALRGHRRRVGEFAAQRSMTCSWRMLTFQFLCLSCCLRSKFVSNQGTNVLQNFYVSEPRVYLFIFLFIYSFKRFVFRSWKKQTAITYQSLCCLKT